MSSNQMHKLQNTTPHPQFPKACALVRNEEMHLVSAITSPGLTGKKVYY